jgi:hypoxia up-regulated 1
MRIPRIQTELAEKTGLELGLHMNADESMALGAAFLGANVSTAFRVRHVGLTDVNPFAMQVSLTDLQSPSSSSEKWSKDAVIFKAFGKFGVKKTIAFTHDQDVHCSLDYVPDNLLPKGTKPNIESYNITGVAEFAKEMEEKQLGKPKVTLQFELSLSGITSLIRAEATVEETYIVEEEEEVEDDESTEETAENATDNNVTKPKKKIMVEKVSRSWL